MKGNILIFFRILSEFVKRKIDTFCSERKYNLFKKICNLSYELLPTKNVAMNKKINTARMM